MSEVVSDPGLYHRMCEPFPTEDAANAAMAEFWKELRSLREKHHMADVHVTVRVVLPGGEGMVSMHCGSQVYEEPMTAWAFGQAQARRQASVMDLVSSSKALRKPKNTT